jgi:hypothetical protein
MELPRAIDELVRRVAREERWRRAEYGAWLGAFAGTCLALAPLAAKGWLTTGGPTEALYVALVLAAVTVGVGAMWAAARRTDRLVSARIADRALGLQDRIATSLETVEHPRTGPAAGPARSPLVEALLADTASRVAAIPRRRLLPHRMPRHLRFIVFPLFAAALLALAPPLPRPDGWLPDGFGYGSNASATQIAASLVERARLFGAELARRDRTIGADSGAKSPQQDQAATGESSPDFKDRALKKPSMDFASFLNKGDDRLRVLGNADRLPDLRSDFATSQVRQLLKRSRELAEGSGGRISAGKLGQILQEMEKLGRRDNSAGLDMRDAFEQLEAGDTEQAYNTMQQQLERLRDQEDRQRDSRRLRGGRDGSQDGAREQGRMDGSLASSELGREGDMAGSGRGPSAKGKPSPRLRSTPYDAGLEGARRGGLPSFEARAANKGGSRMNLQYLSEIGQYRRQMEDAMSREQIPRGYHDQIRNYFKSLND